MAHLSDQAIVLRTWDFSETSQTAAVLLRDHGVLRGIAKGSRRERSTFSGGLEPTATGDLAAIVHPSRELATITEFALRRVCFAARRSLAAHRAATYLIDLTYHALSPGDPHPTVFDALSEALQRVAVPGPAIAQFAWRLLEDTGVSPRLDIDIRSGAALPERGPVGFDPIAGGLTSDPGPAPPGRDGPWRISPQTRDALVRLERGDELDEPLSGRAARLLAAHWTVILGRDLPSRAPALEEPRRVDDSSPRADDSAPKGAAPCQC